MMVRIITGAPVERMEYEEVAYWKEVCEIMDWTENMLGLLSIFVGVLLQGLYHHYGIKIL